MEVRLAGRSWRLTGDPGDSYFRHIADHAAGMAEMTAIAAALLPAQGVALDVGANLGLTAIAFAALAPQGRVIAVEPAPRTFAALRANLAANGLDGRVAAEGVALAAAPGEVAFHAEPDHSAGAKLVSDRALDRARLAPETVRAETLDALVARHGLGRLDLIKVDVEGFEGDVLDGAAATLARFRPACIVEFNAWTLLCNRDANPRHVLEAWLARFPFVHAFRGQAAPQRVTAETALGFLHDHLVQRRCADDLVLSFDAAWLGRWRPPAG
ncbi:MAG TPA: FkbM family methyltransferase [Crenalkalicoccus sp.]|nr:FkbM family methyltransferase [Crenalkalicoccus sp.]